MPGFEGGPIEEIFRRSPTIKTRLAQHCNLLMDLQRIHDDCLPREWENEWKAIAFTHALTYTRP